MGEPLLHGLMMDDYPLSLTTVVERAEQLTPTRKVVYRRSDGNVHRTTMGDCARRARRLAAGLQDLGIGEGDRVGTLMWNQPEHLEAYYGVPSMGAVVHTLNPRLHPDELGFIAGDAEDRAIIVDESLLQVLESFRAAYDFEHVIVVMSENPAHPVPDGAIAYESLIEGAEPMEWPGPARAAGGRDLLHVGHDRPAEGGPLLPPGAGAPLDGGGAAGRYERLVARHRAASRPDVPRQRLGHPLHGDDDGRPRSSFPARSSTARASSTFSPTRRSRSRPACRPSGWRC